jgi:hypothetical protein
MGHVQIIPTGSTTYLIIMFMTFSSANQLLLLSYLNYFQRYFFKLYLNIYLNKN